MSDIYASLAVAGALCGWTVLGLTVTRAAERRALGTQPPAPWVSLGLAVPLATLAVLLQPNSFAAAATGATCISLVVGACTDVRTGFIFDALTLPAAVLVASLAVASGAAGEAAYGVALLVGGFGATYLYSRGRWLGLGDVKAMYAVGAAFGPAESLVVVFAACLSGIAAAAWRGRFTRGYELRFGPHLAAGAAFTLVAGGPIVHGLLGL